MRKSDLVIVCGPKNDLVSFWESIHFVFLWVLETDFVFVSVPKMIWFRVGVEINLVCVREVEIDLGDWNYSIVFSRGGSKLTCF